MAPSSLVNHCMALSAEGNTCNMMHLSLQFGGAEILLNPYPADSKASAEAAIMDKSGFEVNLGEKHRKFSLQYVVLAPISVERRDSPPIDSILYESGNCILLSIFMTVGDADLLESITDAAGSSPHVCSRSEDLRAAPYAPRCGFSLMCRYMRFRPGAGYMANAGGMCEEPQRVSICISPREIASLSDLDATYLHILSDIRDYLSPEIDNPIIFGYTHDYAMSDTRSQAQTQEDIISLPILAAGR